MILFCHVTSKVDDEKYPKLLSEKGGTGFPFLAWLDADGNVVAKQGDRSVAGFQKTLASCQSFLALEKKAKDGDKSVAADLLMARIDMGQVNFDQAKEQMAALGKLDAGKQKQFEGLLLGLEVDSMMASVRAQPQAVEVGKKFAAMQAAGRIPTGKSARTFYSMIMTAMEADKDAKGFEKALDAFKKLTADEPNAKRIHDQFDQRLAKLKGGS